jgi:hypothetical protein
MTMRGSMKMLVGAFALAIAVPATAVASTWTVDDDHVQCPNAGFSTIQAAINQAAPWDTVVICPGDYAEAITAPNATNSPAQAGSKAGLLITKPLTIRGAGADKVTIHPAASAAPSLAGTAPFLRDGGGAVVQIDRQSLGSSDVTEDFVDISGVTITSPDIYAEAGVSFFNTSGRISDSVIGPFKRATDATDLAAHPHGYGVIMTNSLQGASEAAVRREVSVVDSLVTGYQSGGILFDSARGADGNAANTVRSGIRTYGWVSGTRVVGSGPDSVIPQIGIHWHAGARGSVTGSSVSDNMFTPDPRQSPGVLLTDAETGPDPSNPAVRGFSATSNLIERNGFGLFNANITNSAVRLGASALATMNWWGCPAGPGNAPCNDVSGPDTASAPSVEYTPFYEAAFPGPAVPGPITDAPPTGSFVDPAEGGDVAVGQTATPTVVAHDDFGVKSVSVTLDGSPFASDGLAPYEFSWTPTYADIGATHTFVATITDSSGQTTVVTRHVHVPVPPGYNAATLAPPTWDAGTVLVGYQATRSFVFTNSGQNPVSVSSVAVSGDPSFALVPAPNSCTPATVLAIGATCGVVVSFTPTSEGPEVGSLSVGYSAPGAASPAVAALAGNGHILSSTVPGEVGGTVPTTLGLTLSSLTSTLGSFVAGVDADYTTSVAIGVTSSGGGAALTVQDPSAVATGHLVNGAFSLMSPLMARSGVVTPFAPVGSSASPLVLQTYAMPVTDDPVAVTFKQSISATEPLRTGSYSKTVLFTLSTTTP